MVGLWCLWQRKWAAQVPRNHITVHFHFGVFNLLCQGLDLSPAGLIQRGQIHVSEVDLYIQVNKTGKKTIPMF